MKTQEKFLERLWIEVIREGHDGRWIDAAIKKAAKTSKKSAERNTVTDGNLADLLKSNISQPCDTLPCTLKPKRREGCDARSLGRVGVWAPASYIVG